MVSAIRSNLDSILSVFNAILVKSGMDAAKIGSLPSSNLKKSVEAIKKADSQIASLAIQIIPNMKTISREDQAHFFAARLASLRPAIENLEKMEKLASTRKKLFSQMVSQSKPQDLADFITNIPKNDDISSAVDALKQAILEMKQRLGH